MLKVEIASYPKSGNTWFRRLTEEYLRKSFGVELSTQGIHQHKLENVMSDSCAYVPEIESELLVYKSHVHNNRSVSPDKIVHIQRHPLDVFLSALNYLYIQSENIVAGKKAAIWIDGDPKSVEDIYAHGEMDHYIKQFTSYAGANFWPSMLGHQSNYFEYVRNANRCDKTVTIRFEDLIDNAEKETNTVMNKIFGIDSEVSLDLFSVDQITKNMNTPFFWKSKKGNYRDFLEVEQIKNFEQRYERDLEALGYISEFPFVRQTSEDAPVHDPEIAPEGRLESSDIVSRLQDRVQELEQENELLRNMYVKERMNIFTN